MAKKTLRCPKCDTKLQRPTDPKVTEIVCRTCGFIKKRKSRKKAGEEAQVNIVVLACGGGVALLVLLAGFFFFFSGNAEKTAPGELVATQNKPQTPQLKEVPAGAALDYRVDGKNYKEWVEEYLVARKAQDQDRMKIAREGFGKAFKEMPEDLSILDELLGYHLGDYEELEHVKLYARNFLYRVVEKYPAVVAERINKAPAEPSSRGHTLDLLRRAGPNALLASDYLYGLLDVYPDGYRDVFSFLSEIGPEAVPFFTELLDDERFVKQSLNFLWLMKTDAKSALPSILKNWERFPVAVQNDAIITMSLIAPGDSKAIEMTETFYATGEKSIHTCVPAFIRHGNDGIEKLVELCSDTKTLEIALLTAGNIPKGDELPSATWQIVKIGLESNDERLIGHACRAAHRLEDQFKKVVPQLSNLLDSESPLVKATATSTLFENLDIKVLSIDILVSTLLQNSSSPEMFNMLSDEIRKRGDKIKPFLVKISEAADQMKLAADKQIEEDKNWFYAQFRNDKNGLPSISRVKRTVGGEMRVPGELKLRMEISGYSFVGVEKIDSKFSHETIQGVERLKKFVAEFK